MDLVCLFCRLYSDLVTYAAVASNIFYSYLIPKS